MLIDMLVRLWFEALVLLVLVALATILAKSLPFCLTWESEEHPLAKKEPGACLVVVDGYFLR